MPYYQHKNLDPSKLSNREIESILGMQYSNLVKENKELNGIYRDCEDVINGSLALLDKYNRINLNIKTKAKQVSNAFFG